MIKSFYLNSDDEDLVLTHVLRLVRDVDDVGLLGGGALLLTFGELFRRVKLDRRDFGDRMY